MNKTLVARNDNVIIKPLEAEEELHGNLIIPDLGQEKPQTGTVISVGPGRFTEFGHFKMVECEVGDIVLVPKIGTIRITFEGEEYWITSDKEILAVIKPLN